MATFRCHQTRGPNLTPRPPHRLDFPLLWSSDGARVELRCRSPRELGSEPRSSDFELLWSLDLSLLGDPMELIWTISWSLHPDPELSSAQLSSAQPGSAQLSPAQLSSAQLTPAHEAQLSPAQPNSAQLSPAQIARPISQNTGKAQDCLEMLILLTKHFAGAHFFLLSLSQPL